MSVRDTIRLVVVLAFVFLLLLVHLVPPVSNVLVGVAVPVVEGFNGLRKLAAGVADAMPLRSNGRRRLRALEDELERLQLEMTRHRSVMVQNSELRQMLDLPPLPGWHRVVAPVVARDPASWNRRFRIGKGTADGIRPGAVVVHGTNVIGRVHSVAGNSAVVVTLADPACRISVRLQDSGAVGILHGRLGQTWHDTPICLIDFLPRDEAYRPGEAVQTSGLSETIPGGLRVGHVIRWDPEHVADVVKSAYARLKMRPAAGLDGFRYVAVLHVAENAKSHPE